jgi:hypothetical protein
MMRPWAPLPDRFFNTLDCVGVVIFGLVALLVTLLVIVPQYIFWLLVGRWFDREGPQ